MLLRRYGSTVHSIEMNFDARALNEIAFRRTTTLSIPAEDFGATYQRVGEHGLTAEAEGWVQDEAEQELLRRLADQVDAVLAGLGPDEVLLVESEAGTDYPKTRDEKKNLVVEGENRLFFHWRVEPQLRLGVYRRPA